MRLSLAMRDLASARLRGGALVAVTGAAQAHQARDLLQQLLRRAELLRLARSSRHAAELPWIGPGQPRDHRWVRAEGDRIAGGQRLVVLGHGEVLVDDRAPLEDDVADDRSLLEPDRHRHGAGRVRELATEPAQRSRLAVAELVVHRSPAVARARDDAAARPAEPRHVLAHRLLHGALVIALHVGGTEARTPRRAL